MHSVFPQKNIHKHNTDVIMESMNAISLTLFEKILIASGMLFFVNAAWLASGGGFEALLYAAKTLYLIGIIILVTES
jgi:hypothetical protein